MIHLFQMASGFAEDFTLGTGTTPVNSRPDRLRGMPDKSGEAFPLINR
jgi:hypothetical protein